MPIKINGTNTAASPSITGSDTDTGIVYGSDQIDFSTGGSSKVTLNGSNLGIGGTAPNYQLHATTNIAVGSHGLNQQLLLGNNSVQSQLLGTGYTNLSLNALGGNVGIGTASPTAELSVAATAPHIDIGQAGSTRMKIGYEGNNCFFGATASTGMFIFKQNVNLEGHPQASGTEIMRLDSDGKLLIGMTTASTTTQGMMFDSGGESSIFRTSGINLLIGGGQVSQKLVEFRHDGSAIGNISKSGTTGIAYNTSSDYRLKENAVAISDGITRLKTLKPYKFNFKADVDTTVDGFFAHEVTAVPEAISGTKDEVDSDNNPVYQGIDQSKLVPLLTAALQEAIAKIEVLETKVTALEAA